MFSLHGSFLPRGSFPNANLLFSLIHTSHWYSAAYIPRHNYSSCLNGKTEEKVVFAFFFSSFLTLILLQFVDLI